MPTAIDPRAAATAAANNAATDASADEAQADANQVAADAQVTAAAATQQASAFEAAATAGPNDGAVQMATVATPELPDAREAPATPRSTLNFLNLVGGLSDYSAFAIIQQGQAKALALAGTIKRQAQQGVTTASFQSVKDMMSQISGERASAVFQLAGSVLGAVTSASTAGVGSFMRGNSGDTTRAFGAAMDNSGQQLGNVVSSSVNLIDKTSASGGEYQAQQARIAQKMDDVAKSLAQSLADGARSAYDQAEKAYGSAMQAFSDYFKRKESLQSNITGR